MNGTRIKVCGVTRLDDALAAVAAGAHALGFVFAESSRRIAPAKAGRIVAALPPFVVTVGVTVDASDRELNRIVAESGVDLLQFHGDETLDACLRQPRPVIKRLAVNPGDDARALARRAARYPGVRLLVDPGSGHGVPFEYGRAAAIAAPFVLAGGLHPGNVGAAMRAARPAGVDVSSGVESAPGRKCPDALRAFAGAVRSEDARHAA